MSTFFLAAGIVLVFAAVKASLPSAKASKPCPLGYKAFCTFTPVSGLILLWLAVCLFIERGRMTHAVPNAAANAWLAALTVLFFAGIVFFTVKYAAARKNKKSS